MQIPATLPRPAGDLYAPGWLEGAPTLTTVVPVHPTRAVLARSAVSASVLAVSEVRNRADFMRLEQEWNALVASTHDEPFYRHEFVRVWLDNFAPGERPRFLLARTPDGALAGALPLIFQRTRLHCAPVRRLHAAANEHSCRFDMLATNRSAVAEAFVAHLRADRSWDVLILTDVPRFANAWALEHSAKQAGLPTGEWVSLESPHFALPLPPAAPGCAPSAKFRSNLRRRKKRLESRGPVTFERIEGGPDLMARLEEAYRLEANGWKGREGTAIEQNRETWGFYTELARTAARDGQLALYFLRLDGKPVAFQYGIVHNGTYSVLKTAYDEQHSECSPGQLLMNEVVEDCTLRGLREFDFLGPNMHWKTEWTDEVRRHSWLFIFPDTPYGRLLHGAKFGWGPGLFHRAKKVYGRWRKE